MGAEDHLFLPSIKTIVKSHTTAILYVVEKCGHVVNVEQPKLFNTTTIQFINTKR